MKIFDYKRKLVFNTYLSGFIGFIIFILSVVTIYSNLSADRKLTYKSQASGVSECTDGSWRQECMNPKERQTCASDAGVEQVFLCEGGQWVYKYPQCAVRCRPDAPPPPSDADARCVGKTPGVTIDSCVRKDCDTNIKKYVCIETYCDNNLQFREKPGRETNEVCGIEQAPCNKGGIIEYCARQECDQASGYYYCVETYWNDSCGSSERRGTLTATRCVENAPPPTGPPVIAWPTITPGGGGDSIVISQPTPTPRPTTLPRPTIKPTSVASDLICNSEGLGWIDDQCYRCSGFGAEPVKYPDSACMLAEPTPLIIEEFWPCPEMVGPYLYQGQCYYCQGLGPPAGLLNSSDCLSTGTKLTPTPGTGWCKWIGQTGLANGECYYCFSPYIAPVKTELTKCATVEKITIQAKISPLPQPNLEQNTNCDYSSLKECRIDCLPPAQCTAISRYCYKCYSPSELTQFVAQKKPAVTTSLVVDETKQKTEETGSCTKNTCCGPASICAGTGFLRWGQAKCQPCGITSEVCINGKCQRAGCQTYGEIKIENNLCYGCFKPYPDKAGEYIAVDPKVCQSGQEKVESGDMVTLALHAEDQYHLRQEAFEKYNKDGKGNFGTWLMRTGDTLGHGWGSFGAAAQRTIGNITNNENLKKAEATSSLGNYYVSNMEANAAAEAEGRKRKTCLTLSFMTSDPDCAVTIDKALAGGVAGGLEYADSMTFGGLNFATGGLLNKGTEGLTTAAFGKEGAERKAAESAKAAGVDITNTIALIVPVAKGVGGIGNLTTNVGGKLAGSSSRTLSVAGQGIQAGGKAISWTSKAIEWASPERWAAPFIKSAPVSTFVETSAKALGATKPAVVVGQRVGQLTTYVANKAPVIAKTANAVEKFGNKAFEFIVPRSALTYTPDEAARFLARDIKLGLADEAGAVERLASKYRVTPGQITDPAKFTKTLEQELQAPAGKVYQRIGLDKSVGVDVNKAVSNVGKEVERINQLKQRITQIKTVQSDSTIPADQIVKTNVETYTKKFSGIKNKDELAEAILHDWEKVDDEIYIANIHQLAAAQRYANEVLSLRTQNSIANRVKTGVANLGEEVKIRLSGTKKQTAIQKLSNNQDNLFFNGISKEEVAVALDPTTQEILAKLVRENPDVPLVISKTDIPGFTGKSLGVGQQIVLKEGGPLESIGLKVESKWRGFESYKGQNTAEAIIVYVDPESGIIPRDITALHEYGHLTMGHGTTEATDRIKALTDKYFDQTKPFNQERKLREIQAQDIVQELEAETVAVKQVGQISTDTIRPGIGSYKLQAYLEKWKNILKTEGLNDKQIQTSIDEMFKGSGIKVDTRSPNIIDNIFGFSTSRSQVIKEIGQKTNLSDADLRKLLWEKGVPYSSLDKELSLLKGELSSKVAKSVAQPVARPAVQTAQQTARSAPVVGSRLRSTRGPLKPLGQKPAMTKRAVKAQIAERVPSNTSRDAIEAELRAAGYPEGRIATAVKQIGDRKKIRPQVETPNIDVTKYSANTSTSVAPAPYRATEMTAGQDFVVAGNTGFFRIEGYKNIQGLVIAADGHGVNGNIASRVAAERFAPLFEHYSEQVKLTYRRSDPKLALKWTIDQLDKEVTQIAGTKGGTTFTAGVRVGDRLYIAQLGDSRLYVFRNGKITKLTEAHNWPGGQRKYTILVSRSLGDADVKQLAMAVGGQEGLKEAAQFSIPDIASISVKKGDIILGGSDMLEKMAEKMGGESALNSFITETIQGSAPDKVAEIIVNKAKSLKVYDDMSAAVYQVQSIK